MRIGISISDSPDLASRGLAPLHLQDAMVEIARHLLARGDILCYGGDLREAGFSGLLFDLVRTHAPASGRPGAERVETFLAWPVHLAVDPQIEEGLVGYARVHRLPPPDDLLEVDPTEFLPPTDGWNRYVWARCLTAMRETMNSAIDARIFLGGQVTGWKGKLPGIAEEAYLALRDDKPTFLLGGFGGCTGAVIDALTAAPGAPPIAALSYAQLQREPHHDAMAGFYRTRPASGEAAPDLDVDAWLRGRGVDGLHNQLSRAENEILFETLHVPEMVALVLRGLDALDRVARRQPDQPDVTR